MIEPIAGLALGLAGSLHCVGMCGPIAIALPSEKTPRRTPVAVGGPLLYNAGRVVTYTALGAIIGSGSSAIAFAGYSRALSIVAGLSMIVAVIMQLLWRRAILPTTLIDRGVGKLKIHLRSLLKSHGAATHFSIGLLNGLLPCGLVTAALLGALGTGSVTGAMLFMAAFGLGTVPLMAAVTIGGTRLSCRMKQRLRFVAPTMALIIATLFLLRGSALGIPYISPSTPTLAHPAACCTK